MKKCPFCAEQIQDDAIKCKHCGEMLDSTKPKTKNHFREFETWIKQTYPAYDIVTENEEENFLVLNKKHKPFNGLIFVLLLLLWVIPGLIYLAVSLSGNKIITLTIHFDKDGNPEKINNNNFLFLITKYNSRNNAGNTENKKEPHMVSTKQKTSNHNTLKWIGIIIIAPFCLYIWYLTIPGFAIWYIWKKTNLDKKKKNIYYIIVLAVFIPTWIGLIVFKASPNDTQKKKEVVVNTNIKQEEAKNLSDEEKNVLIKFYRDFVALPKHADEEYAKWADNIGKTSIANTYLQADTVIALNDEVRMKTRKLELPNINLNNESKKKIEDAKNNLSTAYFSKNEAIEAMKDYLNTNDLEKMSKSKEKFNMANSLLIEAIANIMSVLGDNGVDISEI